MHEIVLLIPLWIVRWWEWLLTLWVLHPSVAIPVIIFVVVSGYTFALGKGSRPLQSRRIKIWTNHIMNVMILWVRILATFPVHPLVDLIVHNVFFILLSETG